MLSELTCSIDSYCDNQISEESIKIKGSSNVFSKFPVKVEFKELDKKTMTCFDQYLVEHQNVDIHCIASRNSNKVKKNYFSIITEEKNTKLQTLEKIFLNKRYRIALALSGLLMLGHFLLVPFLTPFMEFNVGFSKDQIQYIYIVGGILTLISAPISGKIADNIGKLKVYIWSAILSLIPVFLITHMPAIAFYYVLVVTGFWFLTSNSRGISAAAMVSNVVPPQLRGSFMSFNSSMQQLFTGLASTITGFIIVSDDITHKIMHYNWAGYLSMAILLICIYLGIKLGEKPTS